MGERRDAGEEIELETKVVSKVDVAWGESRKREGWDETR